MSETTTAEAVCPSCGSRELLWDAAVLDCLPPISGGICTVCGAAFQHQDFGDGRPAFWWTRSTAND